MAEPSYFICFNSELTGSSLGVGNFVGLKTDAVNITLRFNQPVKDVRDERAKKELPDGNTFEFVWKMNEALVISFVGESPR